MEEVTMSQPAPTTGTPVNTTPTPTPKKSKTGCIVAGALGCLWLFIVAGLGGAIIFYAVSQADNNPDEERNYSYNTNDYKYDTNNPDEGPDDTNINSLYEEANVEDSGELIAEDGTSLGFEADSIDPTLFAYQIGAYSSQHFTDTEWPGLRVTLDYPKVQPMTDEADSGSLWVGAVLDNDYFVQVGMMSSADTDADGHMQWNYFWQMWDDQDNYKYGLQEPMSNYDWDQNATNTFTLTCQDPAKGEWEFWVNDQVVGKVNTGNCDMDVYNTQVFWELTTNKTDKAELPKFGPFTLAQFEYWDSYDWQPVQSAELSYGYGRIIDGTESDQASVCPPYGAQPVKNKSFLVGSTVACAENGSVLWD